MSAFRAYSSGNTTSTIDVSGQRPMNVTVASNGSMKGTWALDETAASVTTLARIDCDGSGHR